MWHNEPIKAKKWELIVHPPSFIAYFPISLLMSRSDQKVLTRVLKIALNNNKQTNKNLECDKAHFFYVQK
jgi:hypothetical protein